MEVQQLLSKYMLEIAKVSSEESLYSALAGILRKVIDFLEFNVLRNREIVYAEPVNTIISEENFIDYLSWVEERLYPTFLPTEEFYVGLIPIFKGRKLLAIVVIKTNNEPTAEVIDYLQLLAYLSGITLENLRLLDFIDSSRQYFESIINLSNDGIVVIDENGEIEFKNRTASEITEMIPEIQDIILERARLGEEFFEIEKENLFFSISIKRVTLLAQEKILIDIRNVTSEKEVQKLKEVDKIKTNFIANISHELRTPLAAIKAYVETMLNVPMEQEEAHEFLSIVFNQSLRLESLLNDLLDFSQLESHSLKIVKEKNNVCDILKSALESVINMANENNVKINTQCEDVMLSCDRKRLEQVIVNLLTNAIKFSDKLKQNKNVSIFAYDKGDFVEIIVEDNGIGIPNDKFEKIFEKFYRVDNELTYSVPGTGLGLSIVKEIVEHHNGKITVDSELGKYTKFTLVFPKD
ncbi:MAG: sensor histidine kinase [Fervidobacterium sp.]